MAAVQSYLSIIFQSPRAPPQPLIPAHAGIQHFTYKNWMPACAGMSGEIGIRKNNGEAERAAPRPPVPYRENFLYFSRCGMMLSWPSRRILSAS